MHRAQADADAEVGKAPAVSANSGFTWIRTSDGKRTGGQASAAAPGFTTIELGRLLGHRNRAAALALAGVLAGAAASPVLQPPWPLQEFMPLQACFMSAEAQPPLPLQEFLPAQPASPLLQPPLPLHEFWPLQTCLSEAASCPWPSSSRRAWPECPRPSAPSARQARAREHAGDRQPDRLRRQITLFHPRLLSSPAGAPSESAQPTWLRRVTRVDPSRPAPSPSNDWAEFYPPPGRSQVNFASRPVRPGSVKETRALACHPRSTRTRRPTDLAPRTGTEIPTFAGCGRPPGGQINGCSCPLGCRYYRIDFGLTGVRWISARVGCREPGRRQADSERPLDVLEEADQARK